MKATPLAHLIRPVTIFVLAAFVFISLGLLAGCEKKKIRSDYPLKPTEKPSVWKTDETDSADQAGEQDSGILGAAGGQAGQMEEEGLAAATTAGAGNEASDAELATLTPVDEAAREAFSAEDIYFEFDSAALMAEAQAVLREKAQWLNANPGAVIIIEGHTDERGTVEYNLALGDRRAEAARAFLVELGIDSERMRTISFGEERPMDPGHDEQAWAKNRRAHFAID